MNNVKVKGQLHSCIIFLYWGKPTSSQHIWINGEHMLGRGHYVPVKFMKLSFGKKSEMESAELPLCLCLTCSLIASSHLILKALIHFPQIIKLNCGPLAPSTEVGAAIFSLARRKQDKHSTHETTMMGKIDELLGAAATAALLVNAAAVEHFTASISTMTAPIAHTGSGRMCIVCAGSGRVAMGISVKCSAGPSSELDIMIIPRNSDYCHGGMKICQGHVRTDTGPEQINRAVSFSPTAGTEREKKEKN